MNCTIKNEDIKFGLKAEYKLFKYLRKENPDVEWLTKKDPYSHFDYRLGDHFIELKTRHYVKKRFDYEGSKGHMIETSKFQYLKKNKIKSASIFYLYEDGLYRYDFKRSECNKGVTQGLGGRKDRAVCELKKTSYIKGRYLKLITTKIKAPKKISLCVL